MGEKRKCPQCGSTEGFVVVERGEAHFVVDGPLYITEGGEVPGMSAIPDSVEPDDGSTSEVVCIKCGHRSALFP